VGNSKRGKNSEKWRDTSPLAQIARAVTLKAARSLDLQLDLPRDRLAGAASSRATQKARAGCWGRVRSRKFAGDTLQRRRNSHRHRSDCLDRCTDADRNRRTLMRRNDGQRKSDYPLISRVTSSTVRISLTEWNAARLTDEV